MSAEAQVRRAAAELVAAFASNDTPRYFAAFSEDATYVFHSLPAPLRSRSEYRALWQGWQDDGFVVRDCRSSNAHVSLQGDTAIFVHDVTTDICVDGRESRLEERETIVFRHDGERWLACHEHLSAIPTPT